jgi:hypothetical protein
MATAVPRTPTSWASRAWHRVTDPIASLIHHVAAAPGALYHKAAKAVGGAHDKTVAAASHAAGAAARGAGGAARAVGGTAAAAAGGVQHGAAAAADAAKGTINTAAHTAQVCVRLQLPGPFLSLPPLGRGDSPFPLGARVGKGLLGGTSLTNPSREVVFSQGHPQDTPAPP